MKIQLLMKFMNQDIKLWTVMLICMMMIKLIHLVLVNLQCSMKKVMVDLKKLKIIKIKNIDSYKLTINLKINKMTMKSIIMMVIKNINMIQKLILRMKVMELQMIHMHHLIIMNQKSPIMKKKKLILLKLKVKKILLFLKLMFLKNIMTLIHNHQSLLQLMD